MPLINISVQYYNPMQQGLFQGYPNAARLNEIVQNPLTISSDELEAYMMFKDQDNNAEGYRNYNELRALIGSRIGDLNNYVTYNNGSIQSKVAPERMNNANYTERLGVGLGLCVINKIHDLMQADWEKIPEQRGRGAEPRFDFTYQLATDGNNYIQVENKGSIVRDNSLPELVANQYSGRHGIRTKKETVRPLFQNNNQNNLFYGTIGVLDNEVNSIAKVWLVDPPPFELEIEPQKYKLLARLYYYLKEFRNIGVREAITRPLEKRIKEIEESKEYLTLNNKPLEFNNPHTYHLFMENRMFAAVNKNEAFGKIFMIDYKRRLLPYLIAFPKTLMRLIILQNFNEILNYKYQHRFRDDTVNVLMRFNINEMEEYKLRDNFKDEFKPKGRKFELVIEGKISYCSDGRIFGLLNNPFD